MYGMLAAGGCDLRNAARARGDTLRLRRLAAEAGDFAQGGACKAHPGAETALQMLHMQTFETQIFLDAARAFDGVTEMPF